MASLLQSSLQQRKIGMREIMVSINTSTSFLETKKPEDPVNDSEMSGLENIFASMLAVIKEENQTEGGQDELEHCDGVVGLLEKLQNEMGQDKKTATIHSFQETAPRILSSDIVKLYEANKTLIDEAIEIANEATISFDMQRLLKGRFTQNNTLSVDLQKPEMPNKILLEQNEKKYLSTGSISQDESLEEFSALQMERVKNTMKQPENLLPSLGNDKSPKTKGANETQSFISNQIVKQKKTKESGLSDKLLSDNGQTNVNMKLSQAGDSSKGEALIDQSQTSGKPQSIKLAIPEQNLKGNLSSDQAHLKLLEKNWGKDLAKIIEKAIVSGKEKIDINLEPQRLGKMQLTLSVINNQTSIFIGTDSTAASLILTTAEERLAQMLESAGYKLTNFQANTNGKNGSNQNGSEAKHQRASKGEISKNEPALSKSNHNQATVAADGRKIINVIA